MQSKEFLIVPALGVVILLATFLLGVPLVYKLLLGLLGLAAAGTYFAPHAVQVETRIAIAAAGLIILLIVTSTAFWLTLLSFGGIAALQFQHLHTLQRNSATVAWVTSLLGRAKASAPVAQSPLGDASAPSAPSPPEDEAVAPTTAPQAQAPLGVTVPGFVRLDAAGVGSSALGALALMCVFLPWLGIMASAYGQTESESFTLGEMADDFGAADTFFVLLVLLALVSIISIVAPRIVGVIVGAVGLIVAASSYVYFQSEIMEGIRDAPADVDLLILPSVGCILAGLCYLGIAVLPLIPRMNRQKEDA